MLRGRHVWGENSGPTSAGKTGGSAYRGPDIPLAAIHAGLGHISLRRNFEEPAHAKLCECLDEGGGCNTDPQKKTRMLKKNAKTQINAKKHKLQINLGATPRCTLSAGEKFSAPLGKFLFILLEIKHIVDPPPKCISNKKLTKFWSRGKLAP